LYWSGCSIIKGWLVHSDQEPDQILTGHIMPKFLKIILACTICLGIAGLAIWLIERLGG
jgi:hypothetical protein